MPTTCPPDDDAPDDAALPAIPAGSSARRWPFDRATLTEVAALLAGTLEAAPFQLHGAPVFRLTVPGSEAAPNDDTAEVRPDNCILMCWPSIGRLDVSRAREGLSVVTTGIAAVDLIPGVEAVFRHAHGSVTVARGGRVMVRTGPVGHAASIGRG